MKYCKLNVSLSCAEYASREVLSVPPMNILWHTHPATQEKIFIRPQKILTPTPVALLTIKRNIIHSKRLVFILTETLMN